MKSLLILRHAKAEADSYDGRDITRSLASRGKEDAARAGKVLRKLELVPDLIVTSPAVRTVETVTELLGKLHHQPPVVEEPGIYEATAEALLGIIKKQNEGDRILLVGHNPGLEELIVRLVATSGGMQSWLPTCGMARIDFEVSSWSDIAAGAGSLIWLTNPEMLREL